MTDPDRLPCIVPGCGRGIGIAAWRKRFGDLDPNDSDYVCQRHWSAVPARMRMVYARVRRRERRFEARLPAAARVWRRIMREIDRATHDGHPAA